MDWLGIWGAIIGSIGALLAGLREFLHRRRRLKIIPGVNLTTSRIEPEGEILMGWACVAFWNAGGRDLSIEQVGFRYRAVTEGGDERPMRAKILLDEPLKAAVDGPTQKVYTPLGPMLAAGISLFLPLEAFATTTGGHEWLSPPQPLVQSMPPVSSTEQVQRGLERLREEAQPPPLVGNEIGLAREKPRLIDEAEHARRFPR